MEEKHIQRYREWLVNFCNTHQFNEERFTASAVQTAIDSAEADPTVLAHYARTSREPNVSF